LSAASALAAGALESLTVAALAPIYEQSAFDRLDGA
jgi:hypothetical protein